MLRTLMLAVVASFAVVGPADDSVTLLKKYLEHSKPTAKEIQRAAWLLHHGASFKTVSGRGYTTVMFAARWGQTSLLKEAIKARVDVNAHTFDLGLTALMNSNPEAMQILLDAGADPNAQDTLGRTPLMWAAQWKSRKSIELLLAHGAKPQTKNAKGFTAVTYAEGSPGLQTLLRQHGAR